MNRSSEPQTGACSADDVSTRRSDLDNGRTAPQDRREISFSDEIKRKALHLLALVIPLGIWLTGRTLALIVLATLAALAVLADILRTRSQRFASAIYRYFALLMRPEECPPLNGPIVLNGATWVILSALLLIVLFPVEVAVGAFTTFMIADAAAAVVGRAIGRRRWPRTSRTVEGSSAFFVTGLSVMLAFGWTSFWISVISVMAGTAAEIPSGPLNDNIRVPLVIGLVIYASQLIGA